MYGTPPRGAFLFSAAATGADHPTVGIGGTPWLIYAAAMIIRILLGLVLAVPAYAAVYKWVDDQGNVHYGDNPPAQGASPVDLPDYSRYAPRPLPKSSDGGAKPMPAEDADNPAAYRKLAIVQPEQNGTVRSSDGVVAVQVDLEPALGKSHYIVLTLDGVRRSDPIQATSINLSDVDRGSHVLQATVQDDAGRTMLRSGTVRFTLRQDSLYMRMKPEPKSSGSSGQTGTDAPQYQPGSTTDTYQPDTGGIPASSGGTNTDLKGDYSPSSGTGYTPSGGGISSTPGKTNPAFAPKYTP